MYSFFLCLFEVVFTKKKCDVHILRKLINKPNYSINEELQSVFTRVCVIHTSFFFCYSSKLLINIGLVFLIIIVYIT